MEEKKFLEMYSTPMYVFDAGVLKKRVNYLKEMLPDNVSLCYAIKANNFIVKELNDIIDRFEVCSPGELSVCRELDVPTEKIIFSGVYKTPSVIYELMEEDVPMGIYSIESMVQYKLLMEAASKYGRSITVMPRLTSGNQFGMTKDEVKTIIAEVKEMPNVTVEGIQFFSGTQKNSLKKLKRELTKLDEFIQVLKDELDYVPNELEFGPGFPVTYFKDEEFDEDEFLNGFSEIINEMNFKSKITLELGRSIAACCGTYYTSVVDMKSNKGQNYAIVDGGMNHLVYFGQSMAMKHPMCSVLPERDDENTVDWTTFLIIFLLSWHCHLHIQRPFHLPSTQNARCPPFNFRDISASIPGSAPFSPGMLYHAVLRRSVVSNICHAMDCSPGEGNGTPLQYSCLENPTEGGAW